MSTQTITTSTKTVQSYNILLLIILSTSSYSSSEVRDHSIPCPKGCICAKPPQVPKVDCSKLNLTSVPVDININVLSLDLSSNNISTLLSSSFRHLPNLNELNLGRNNLHSLPFEVFAGLSKLKVLWLHNNQFKKVPTAALSGLSNLEVLYLSANNLTRVPEASLTHLSSLQRLWLDKNELTEVPTDTLQDLPKLQALNMASNNIRQIPDYAFQNLSTLFILVLKRNKIDTIGEKAFTDLTVLKVLEIDGNKLKKLPSGLATLHTLRELTFANNDIKHLPDFAFKSNSQLTLLEMGGNPLTEIGRYTFSSLPNLKELILSDVRNLEEFPDLTETNALEHLRLDRALLHTVPPNFCHQVPLLKSLNLKSNRLSSIPQLEECEELRLIDFSYNRIRLLENAPFQKQKKLIDLFLGDNLIEIIPADAFRGLSVLQVLSLANNRIEEIHPDTFVSVPRLRDLNLGNNQFPTLPTKGLQNIRQLKTFNNPNLKDFPSPESFPRVHTLALSYSYHCCAFLSVTRQTPGKPVNLQETIVWLTKDDVDMSTWSTNVTDVWPGYDNFSSKFEEFAVQFWKSFGRDYAIPDNLAQYAEEYFEDYKSFYNSEDTLLAHYPIKCIPQPDPFLPCDDLFGWWTLRCGIWIVFLLAMLGNGVVVVVLMFGRSIMDVPRFLVCNLAIADFFMGIYLGILAVVDASTLGEFQVYGISWQGSAGCQIAGFLGVLSSELSVYTLSVITLERNYAITHAMYVNKRLSLKHAAYIMAAGWTFALIMAIMPLCGVSNYKKFAVCLPFETESKVSLGYVVFLILINGIAFVILMGCYLKMYCAIRGSQAWNSNDSRIAKRMALLVFTDFVCWSPIAFFSLTAVFGLHLISLEEAKVFTIFVLPLNSCANPFLYAIFTKQFKKDCVLICKRIEESRVTRGIGRCRHSSNFSNRHTPANTNSAADRKSADSDQPTCQCGQHKVVDEPKQTEYRSRWKAFAMRYFLCQEPEVQNDTNTYTFAIAQIQKNIERTTKRGASVSSDNFSSRSDSWRQTNIPLRLLERGARRNSYNFTRKNSQDSNMSCSRQDSSTSTFRMSRSSISSDRSDSHLVRPGLARLRDRNLFGPVVIEQSHGTRPFSNVLERSFVNGETRFIRGMVGAAKENPKLCRQIAVDDTCVPRVLGKRYDFRSLQKSPPVGPTVSEGLCPSCAKKDPSSSLKFKNKELEDKFNCFYNRLAETSHEDSSEVLTSKEDQVLLSSDQSTGDQKVDSSNTHDTSIPDSSAQHAEITINPHIAIEGNVSQDREKECLEDKVNNWLRTSATDVMGGSEGKLQVSVESSLNANHLCVSADCIQNPKSQSMTYIGSDSKLNLGRKVASDNSLKKLSLKSLPSLLRSLSSQSTQKLQRLKVRSQCQLRPKSKGYLSCSESQTTIKKYSDDIICERASPVSPSSFKKLKTEEECESDSDIEDVFIEIKCHPADSNYGKSPENEHFTPTDMKEMPEQSTIQTMLSINEEVPLIEQDLQNMRQSSE
ncbi:leucine-rich repeat-containing G-protein coupled receptor 5-like [Limulus polyphemus]|uniref:Leucine-rich repeat-containing G-protein coupled receptor 5-like n=1 Tax=Limulus polyphemus TaxID=6850 RepID=A0ABM1T322_LIMPO|nr:leucine-rich repeat-containing G-protein coupled receptor 5-like [Limulus polyphemus]